APLLSAEARLLAKADAGRGRIACNAIRERGPSTSPTRTICVETAPHPSSLPVRTGRGKSLHLLHQTRGGEGARDHAADIDAAAAWLLLRLGLWFRARMHHQ